MSLLKRWAPVALWMSLIYGLSAQSHLPTPEHRWLDVVIEKSAHAFEFGVLTLLLLRALPTDPSSRRRSLIFAVCVACVYALTDEFHQRYVPGRSADWTDILADWSGVVTVAVLWWQVQLRRREKSDAVGRS